MKAEQNHLLTLLYDATCPVCSLEMDHLRERDGAHRLAFVDIAEPGFDAAAYGCSLAELNAQIHAVRPDGSHLIGLAALREAYAAVDLAWVLKATALAPLRPLADAGYALFARHRQPISRAAAPLIHALRTWRAWRAQARMARCQAGVCAVPADSQDGG
jgi:predicted DCC family thiol-disulfide oxidoreductase YuxK